LLKTFAQMSKTDSGRNDLSRLFVRLTDAPQGAKLLSNLVRDRNNAKQLAGVFNTLQESPQAAVRLRVALEKAQHNPLARRDMEVFRGRAAVDPGLREAMEKLSSNPTQSQPLQLTQSARGADAMAKLTAFENLARAVSLQAGDTPVKTVAPSGASSGGGTSDGSQNPSGGGGQDPESRPAPSQALPYPELAIVSEAWRSQSASRAEGERLAEQAQGAAAEQTEGKNQEERPSAFRPGDVYSDMTLLRARICGDCGFRTNSTGKCSRCGFDLLDTKK